MIIQSLEIIHHVDCHRKLEPPARIAAFPRQQSPLSDLSQTVSSQDSVREAPSHPLGRTLNLLKILIRMAPERCIPRHIQCINRLIFFLQPPLKCLLAERAMAFSTQFIRNVPHFYRRVLSKLLAQQAINFPHLFPVNRRSITVIMASAEQIFRAVRVYAQYLRVLVCKPLRACCRRCRENY